MQRATRRRPPLRLHHPDLLVAEVGAHSNPVALFTDDVDQLELLEQRGNGVEAFADLGLRLDGDGAAADCTARANRVTLSLRHPRASISRNDSDAGATLEMQQR
jgi:hypothetical protein